MFFFNKVNRYAKHNRRLKRLLIFVLTAAGLLYLLRSEYFQFPDVGNMEDGLGEASFDYNVNANLLDVETIPQVFGPSETAVLVMSATRQAALKNHLEQLLRFRPKHSPMPIIISQDGTTESVTHLATLYANSSANIFFIHHKNRTGVGSPAQKAAKNYFYISQHYKWALDRVFMEMGYKTVIITEDDLDIAEDFFSYFAATRRILLEDSSLWCISAWNDDDAASVTDRSKNDFGLYKTFPTSIHLPDSPVDFSKVNVDALMKGEYDINLVPILRNATLLSLEQLDGVLDTDTNYKIIC
uniref:Alpha-1,3-mannosyl-glycoprotein 2-beta-N-acetylglucosaminyltransferase n=1 Tax=Steinernema glaseri TaxID=37863 RepID=A0A1I7Y3D4_9BILA